MGSGEGPLDKLQQVGGGVRPTVSKEREKRPRDNATHPSHHDTRERAEQHLRDEAPHPEDSSWPYNDIAADNYK